jgi:hypothetical protein
MIPTLDWWPMADPFDGRQLQLYLTTDMSAPTRLDSIDFWHHDSCLAGNASWWCPGYGFSVLDDWVVSSSKEATLRNITLTENLSRYQRILSAGTTSSQRPGYAVATTINDAAVHALGLSWDYAMGPQSSLGAIDQSADQESSSRDLMS